MRGTSEFSDQIDLCPDRPKVRCGEEKRTNNKDGLQNTFMVSNIITVNK